MGRRDRGKEGVEEHWEEVWVSVGGGSVGWCGVCGGLDGLLIWLLGVPAPPARTGRRYRGGFDECGSEKLEWIRGWGENSSCLCEAVAASKPEEMPGYNKISSRVGRMSGRVSVNQKDPSRKT